MATDIQESANKKTSKTASAPAVPTRILYVNTWSSCHGGSSTSLIDIVSNLDRTKFDPLVLCPEPGPLPERLQDTGVPCVIRPITSLTREHAIRFAIEVPQYIRLLKKNKIGLVHANTGCWRRSVAMAAKLTKTPLIQHIRNPISDYRSDFVLKYASRIVTNSDQVGRQLRDDPNYRDRTTTIYNSVNLDLYRDADDRRDEISAGDRPIIGFVGQIVPRKGLVTLIKAMPAILAVEPRAMLVIVGCSPPEDDSYEQDCQKLIRELGVSDSVRFVGFRRDVAAWMRTFDVFALPTRSEPFGKVIIEAMAGGCPVVATAVGGIPEIVENRELGTLVEPDDVEGVAKGVIDFLSSPEKSTLIARRAQLHVQEKFGMKRMMQHLEALYDEVLSR